jgi:hypothetical protein
MGLSYADLLQAAVRLALFLALAFAGPALAWDPAGVASVDTRRAELRKAWEGKDAGAILQDKIERARQKTRPAWVDHKAWYIEEGGRRLYFGVGVSPRLPAGTLDSADFSGIEANPGAPAPLDWYFDPGASVLYALIVDERQ